MELTKESLSSIQFRLKGSKYYYAEEVDKTIDEIIQLAEKQSFALERLKKLENDNTLRSNMTVQEEIILRNEVVRLQALEHEFEQAGTTELESGANTQALLELEQEFESYKALVREQLFELFEECELLQDKLAHQQALPDKDNASNQKAQIKAQDIVEKAQQQAQSILNDANARVDELQEEIKRLEEFKQASLNELQTNYQNCWNVLQSLLEEQKSDAHSA